MKNYSWLADVLSKLTDLNVFAHILVMYRRSHRCAAGDAGSFQWIPEACQFIIRGEVLKKLRPLVYAK